MFSTIKKIINEYTGKSQARHEIRYATYSSFDLQKTRELIRGRLWDGPRVSDYAFGYYKEYNRTGHDDAIKGINRCEIFDIEQYEWGWMNGIENMISKGFFHLTLTDNYMKLCKKYAYNPPIEIHIRINAFYNSQKSNSSI